MRRIRIPQHKRSTDIFFTVHICGFVPIHLYHTTKPLQTNIIMSSADAQLAAKQGNVMQPVESQEFARHFDLTQPEKAMSSYQRLVISLIGAFTRAPANKITLD